MSNFFWSPARLLARGSTLVAALLLAACGGGGSSSTPPPVTAGSGLQPSSSYANMCSVPDQKLFVRSYLDEVYLWYNEIPAVNAANYSTPQDYFNALLVKTPDANGQPKDRFSAVITTSQADALESRALSDASPTLGQAGIPTDLLAVNTGNSSVPQYLTVTSNLGRKVGYIQFNDHNEGAQDALITAFNYLKTAAVQDLVLDMRYNAGGFLYVAQAAASMVAGPSAEGRLFEQVRYNNKRDTETAAGRYLFSSKVQTAEARSPRGAALPQLSLPRLYILASNRTCSASESVVNSLRGIDIQVVLVGATTCGKPYGFRRKDNCGLAYFPIEFQGYNAKDFGAYTTGFAPTCPVADNFTTPLGARNEPLLAAALNHIDTGSCPIAPGLLNSGSLLSRDVAGISRAGEPFEAPAWAGRLLRP